MRVINDVLGPASRLGLRHGRVLERPRRSYLFGRPPVLIAGAASCDGAREAIVAASGCGSAPGFRLRWRGERLAAARQLRARVWVELDRTAVSRSTSFWTASAATSREGRYAAVVSTPTELLDAVAARIDEAAVEIIVDADDAERAAALATRRWPPRTPCTAITTSPPTATPSGCAS